MDKPISLLQNCCVIYWYWDLFLQILPNNSCVLTKFIQEKRNKKLALVKKQCSSNQQHNRRNLTSENKSVTFIHCDFIAFISKTCELVMPENNQPRNIVFLKPNIKSSNKVICKPFFTSIACFSTSLYRLNGKRLKGGIPSQILFLFPFLWFSVIEVVLPILDVLFVSLKNWKNFQLSSSVHFKQVSSVAGLVSELHLRFYFKFKIQIAINLCEFLILSWLDISHLVV